MVVVGVGLIGGSLALDAKRHRLVEEIIGFGRSEQNLRFAKKHGIVDRYLLDEGDTPEDTDFLLSATPVQAEVSTTVRFLPALQQGCIVSDVGSVKGEIVGVISHLPHVLVYALVNSLARTQVPGVDLESYCAGGFKDFTRIASSRPELWRDICLMNRKSIGKTLGDYIKNLERLKGWIEKGRGALLEREFARANEIRGQIP